MSEYGSEDVQDTPDSVDPDATGLYGEAEPDLTESDPTGYPDAETQSADEDR